MELSEAVRRVLAAGTLEGSLGAGMPRHDGEVGPGSMADAARNAWPATCRPIKPDARRQPTARTASPARRRRRRRKSGPSRKVPPVGRWRGSRAMGGRKAGVSSGPPLAGFKSVSPGRCALRFLFAALPPQGHPNRDESGWPLGKPAGARLRSGPAPRRSHWVGLSRAAGVGSVLNRASILIGRSDWMRSAMLARFASRDFEAAVFRK